MVVTGSEYLIDNIPIVSKEYEPLRLFIQSADGKYPLLIIDVINDISFICLVGSGGKPCRLVEGEVHSFPFLFNRFTIYLDHITLMYPVAQCCWLVVYGNPALIDVIIGLPSGTEPCIAYVFIQANGIVMYLFLWPAFAHIFQ